MSALDLLAMLAAALAAAVMSQPLAAYLASSF